MQGSDQSLLHCRCQPRTAVRHGAPAIVGGDPRISVGDCRPGRRTVRSGGCFSDTTAEVRCRSHPHRVRRSTLRISEHGRIAPRKQLRRSIRTEIVHSPVGLDSRTRGPTRSGRWPPVTGELARSVLTPSGDNRPPVVCARHHDKTRFFLPDPRGGAVIVRPTAPIRGLECSGGTRWKSSQSAEGTNPRKAVPRPVRVARGKNRRRPPAGPSRHHPAPSPHPSPRPSPRQKGVEPDSRARDPLPPNRAALGGPPPRADSQARPPRQERQRLLRPGKETRRGVRCNGSRPVAGCEVRRRSRDGPAKR